MIFKKVLSRIHAVISYFCPVHPVQEIHQNQYMMEQKKDKTSCTNRFFFLIQSES